MTRSTPATVETVAIAPVSTCATCGANLSETPCEGHERRTRIDLLFEKVVSHVDAEIKGCPRCYSAPKTFIVTIPANVQVGQSC